VGLSVVWLVYQAIYGVSFISIFRTMAGQHLAGDRPYLPWLFLHLNDVFMFIGWPLALLAGTAMIRTWRQARRQSTLSLGALLVGATALTLLVTDVSGILRGESGRVLLFLSPFVLLSAASACEARNSMTEHHPGWLLTAAQGAIVWVMIAFLPVNLSGVSQPPIASPPVQNPPNVSLPSGAVFGGVFRLNAFSGLVETRSDIPGRLQPTLVLWLDWQSSGQARVPYYLALIPVAPNQDAAVQATLKQPFDGQFPATCWRPGSGLIRDRVEVPLFEGGGAGDWWVSLSLVNGDTGEKLRVVATDGNGDDQVGLGPFPAP